MDGGTFEFIKNVRIYFSLQLSYNCYSFDVADYFAFFCFEERIVFGIP
jgi:hypothetical protein